MMLYEGPMAARISFAVRCSVCGETYKPPYLPEFKYVEVRIRPEDDWLDFGNESPFLVHLVCYEKKKSDAIREKEGAK